MIGTILGAITAIAIVVIICITINSMDKRRHKADTYYTVNNRLRDLIAQIEDIKNNKLKLDIDILLANLRDIKRL